MQAKPRARGSNVGTRWASPQSGREKIGPEEHQTTWTSQEWAWTTASVRPAASRRTCPAGRLLAQCQHLDLEAVGLSTLDRFVLMLAKHIAACTQLATCRDLSMPTAYAATCERTCDPRDASLATGAVASLSGSATGPHPVRGKLGSAVGFTVLRGPPQR